MTTISSHALLDVAFRHAPVAMAVTDPHGRFIDVNAAFAAVVGRSVEELRGEAVLRVVATACVEEERRLAAELLSGARTTVIRLGEMRRPDGSTRAVRATSSVIRGENGQPQLFLTHLEDVTDRAVAEAALGVATGTVDAIIAADPTGRIVFWNSGAEVMFGYRADEMIGRDVLRLVPHRLRATFDVGLETLRETGASPVLDGITELAAVRRDGTEFPVELSVTRERVGDATVFAAVVRDVTKRKALEARLREQATHDGLTGVLSADAFSDSLLERCNGGPVTVIRLDLADFNLVNDSLGHGVGDEVLTAVARRLVEASPAAAVVGRFGGDEFAVGFPCDTRDPQRTALDVARSVARAVAAPLAAYGRTLDLAACVGVAISRPGEPIVQVLRDADTAMHRAKRRGRGRIELYDDALRNEAMARLDLEIGLRRALREGELSLHYQPEIDLRTGRVAAMEALMRWHDPERGSVGPAEFIPVAESAGLIGELGEFAFTEAMRQQARWAEAGIEVGVAINLSVGELSDARLVERVCDVRSGSELPLYVEITESVLMDDVERSGDVLAELSACGVRVAIDDFGTGYSSLAYLKRLPVDVVKIDRSLLPGVESGDDAVVRAVVSMADALGLQTVAEGVETAPQLDAVRTIGCDFAQGFHLARPMPPEDATALLRRRSR